MDPFWLDMEIAEDALARLRRLRAGQNRYNIYLATRHYRYTIVVTIFSALYVESSLKRLIAVRIWFGSHSPERNVLKAIWPERPTIHHMLKFIRASTRFDPELLADIEDLFRRRNRFVHAGVITEEGEHEDPKHGPIKWRGIQSSVTITGEDIDKAEWCFKVAERVRDAVIEAENDPEWGAYPP